MEYIVSIVLIYQEILLFASAVKREIVWPPAARQRPGPPTIEERKNSQQPEETDKPVISSVLLCLSSACFMAPSLYPRFELLRIAFYLLVPFSGVYLYHYPPVQQFLVKRYPVNDPQAEMHQQTEEEVHDRIRMKRELLKKLAADAKAGKITSSGVGEEKNSNK